MGQRAENIVRAYDVLTKRARSLQLQINVALFAASRAWSACRSGSRYALPTGR